MNLRARLSERVHIEDIREVLHFIQDDERLREEVYQLIFDKDHIVSYQALWVCTHFSKADVEWLSRKQEELIDAAMTLSIPEIRAQRDRVSPVAEEYASRQERVVAAWLICHVTVVSAHKTGSQFAALAGEQTSHSGASLFHKSCGRQRF